jgi:hypothetical protein
VEFVVEVDGKNAEVEVRDVEGGGCYKDFSCGQVYKCSKRWFVVRGEGEELHTFLTPILKGWVTWGVLRDGRSFHFCNEGEERGRQFVMGG